MHIQIAIIGAGTAGINVAAQLARKIPADSIRIFDSSNMHYYQSAWTMAAAGFYDFNRTFKPMAQVLPVHQIQNAVTEIIPSQNSLRTNDNLLYTYEQLVIATGLELDWLQIKGAKEALQDPNSNVTSVYEHQYARKLLRLSKTKGTIIFTEPQMPIKCPAAPQKVAYLIQDKQKRENIHSEYHLHKTIGMLFGLPKYNVELTRILNEKGIHLHLKSKLIETKGHYAIFEDQETKQIQEKYFDLLHIVPPQVNNILILWKKPASFISDNGLADSSGFVSVNEKTLQHTKYKNIWSLGDCSNLPTSRTAAGVMDQTPVLVENLIGFWKDKKEANHYYNGNYKLNIFKGYSSCPILISNKKVLLCEFKYNGEIDESFHPYFQSKESRLMFFLKRWVFPWLYWNLMIKGLWKGHQYYKFL